MRAKNAYDTVATLVNDAAFDAVDVLIALANSAPADGLPYLDAGPLEELLVLHGDDVISQIESAAATTPKLRVALAAVDLSLSSTSTSTQQRVSALIR